MSSVLVELPEKLAQQLLPQLLGNNPLQPLSEIRYRRVSGDDGSQLLQQLRELRPTLSQHGASLQLQFASAEQAAALTTVLRQLLSDQLLQPIESPAPDNQPQVSKSPTQAWPAAVDYWQW